MDLNKLIDKLPHKYPILMLDQILEVDEQKSVTKNIIKASNPFFEDNNKLSEMAYIELMAQTTAIYLAHQHIQKDSAQPALGFLIGLKSFDIFSNLEINDEVIVETLITTEKENFYFFDAAIKKENNSVASGEIRVYVQFD